MTGAILITGANGFVGQALCREAVAQGFHVKGATRELCHFAGDIENVSVGTIDGDTDWSAALQGLDAVVHLAARVHVMTDQSSNPLAEFRRVNLEGTVNLARQSADAGVRRFVYLSSIKVNGESTQSHRSFTADDVPSPEDAYGISKYEAEQALRKIALETAMEIVIIRPPLVYGPGVKANFESMIRWLARGIPLPLAAVNNNRRSLVALDNLVDLIVTCLRHPAAANQTFLVSDGEDLSTTDLLRGIGYALRKPARLFYVPVSFLKLGATLLNKPGVYQRLCGSLQLDIGKTQQMLGWKPPLSVNEGLRRAAEEFRA